MVSHASNMPRVIVSIQHLYSSSTNLVSPASDVPRIIVSIAVRQTPRSVSPAAFEYISQPAARHRRQLITTSLWPHAITNSSDTLLPAPALELLAQWQAALISIADCSWIAAVSRRMAQRAPIRSCRVRLPPSSQCCVASMGRYAGGGGGCTVHRWQQTQHAGVRGCCSGDSVSGYVWCTLRVIENGRARTSNNGHVKQQTADWSYLSCGRASNSVQGQPILLDIGC